MKKALRPELPEERSLAGDSHPAALVCGVDSFSGFHQSLVVAGEKRTFAQPVTRAPILLNAAMAELLQTHGAIYVRREWKRRGKPMFKAPPKAWLTAVTVPRPACLTPEDDPTRREFK
jgi:hypothetical protein